MVNFMCWLDWVAGCLDIWSYIILVCLWTCWIFLDKFNIWNSRLRKKDCILTMLVGFVQSVEDLNETTGLPTSKRKFLLPNCPGIGHQFFFLPLVWNLNIGSSCVLRLPAFGFELHHQVFWGSSLPTADLNPFGLRNHVNQFLMINHAHTHTRACTRRRPFGSISLKNFNIHLPLHIFLCYLNTLKNMSSYQYLQFWCNTTAFILVFSLFIICTFLLWPWETWLPFDQNSHCCYHSLSQCTDAVFTLLRL